MLTGLVALILADLPPVSVYSLVIHLSLGEARSKKQDVVLCSSCEAGFRAMATSTRKIIHVGDF